MGRSWRRQRWLKWGVSAKAESVSRCGNVRLYFGHQLGALYAELIMSISFVFSYDKQEFISLPVPMSLSDKCVLQVSDGEIKEQ